jgi:2-dehydro-3-deoxyphosphogluconate aldolase/(4S)-4-hydroxy-2-oxoglutarate aldolase
MQRTEIVATILRERVIGIVRLKDASRVVPVVEAIHAGGVACIEVSLTTPGALDAVRAIRETLPEVLIGAGTVCTPEQAAAAARAGARFLVTPVTLPDLVHLAHSLDVPVAMGAFTPTEIHTAHQAGADLVKVFPASSVDPGYIRAVRAPFPDLRLVPTGGVGVENAGEWLAAGAVALGIGGGLTNGAAIAAGRYHELTDYAARLMASLDAISHPEHAGR